MDREIFLEMSHITKVFPGVKALDDVKLCIRRGEVHALMGENGAGKSTLMNIISGNCRPDEGRIFLEGKEAVFSKVEESQRAGIGFVHQENSLLSYLDVKSNLFLGHFPNRAGFVNAKQIRRKTEELFEKLEIEGIGPDELVCNLSMARRQMVEIAKAVSIGPKLLLLDEPTASLTGAETDILFRLIRRLRDEGVALVYISHRMEEIFRIADIVTVFRDGRHVITAPVGEFDIDSLISHMVGRSLGARMSELMGDRERAIRQEVVLEADGLCRKQEFRDISFKLRRGEVLGLGGLVGAGRTELLEAVYGNLKLDSGRLLIKGKRTVFLHPRSAIQNHIAFVPEDRKLNGLSLSASVKDNLTIATMRKYRRGFLLSGRKQKNAAREYVERLNIRTPTVEQPAGNLSGGNQQKIIIGRGLMTEPEILLLDEPTHGIDVGAKAEIYQIIERLTWEGISVIVASSDMEELLLLSDRILVMHEGRASGFLDKKEATQERVMWYASGQNLNEEDRV